MELTLLKSISKGFAGSSVVFVFLVAFIFFNFFLSFNLLQCIIACSCAEITLRASTIMYYNSLYYLGIVFSFLLLRLDKEQMKLTWHFLWQWPPSTMRLPGSNSGHQAGSPEFFAFSLVRGERGIASNRSLTSHESHTSWDNKVYAADWKKWPPLLERWDDVAKIISTVRVKATESARLLQLPSHPSSCLHPAVWFFEGVNK